MPSVHIPDRGFHVAHLEPDYAFVPLSGQQFRAVGAVAGHELESFKSHQGGESHQTAAAVPAHGPFRAVRIVIVHLEIGTVARAQCHQSVGPYAETPVTKAVDLFWSKIHRSAAVVQDDEVVAGSLILINV